MLNRKKNRKRKLVPRVSFWGKKPVQFEEYIPLSRRKNQTASQGGMVPRATFYMGSTGEEAARHQGHDGQEGEGQESV